MPGIGPTGAMIIEAFTPGMETFKTGRDFAAWLGLIPLQNSTGGKPDRDRENYKDGPKGYPAGS